MAMPILPTIGRTVLYRAADGEDRPAIITKVHSPFCVNLCVMPNCQADIHCGPKDTVTHIGPETGETPTNVSSWRWIPQDLQAAGGPQAEADAVDKVTVARLALLEAQIAALGRLPANAPAAIGENRTMEANPLRGDR
jgi:hypothetical protein